VFGLVELTLERRHHMPHPGQDQSFLDWSVSVGDYALELHFLLSIRTVCRLELSSHENLSMMFKFDRVNHYLRGKAQAGLL
jgi:hypothetical protein